MENKKQNTNSQSVLLYNTQNVDSELLKIGFSIRKKEYQRIWKDIKTGTMERSETHYLIQGVRGAGKTTLLSRLAYEVTDNTDLNKWLIPILLNEEEYGILSLFTFWLRIAEKLSDYNAEKYTSLYQRLLELENDDSGVAWELIRHYLDENGKKIIVFVDNLGELFQDFDDIEHAQLREALSLHPQIRLIGGSSQLLEAHYDGNAPFYQFFKLINLKSISEEEMHELLRSLAKQTSDEAVTTIEDIISNHPERIEAVRRLTDGVPRTIVLLFQIIMEGAKESSYAYLEETIDKTTPLYKHRMDDLPRQQKAIVHAIAMNWDAMSTKEIAEQTRLPSKTVSAQLVKLQKQWIIDKVETDTKNHLYLVKERFFNIWYLMRYGNETDRRRVLWLTRFLETWYGKDNLSSVLMKFAYQHLKQNSFGTKIILTALLASGQIDENIKEVAYKSLPEGEMLSSKPNYLHKIKDISKHIELLVNNKDDEELYTFLEDNFDYVTILDYLKYSNYLSDMESDYFDSHSIIARVLLEKNIGFIEIVHIFEEVFRYNLKGYKETLYPLLEKVVYRDEHNLNSVILMNLYCLYSIWNNDFERFSEVSSKLIKIKLDEDMLPSEHEMKVEIIRVFYFDMIFLLLMAKGQYEIAYNLFDNIELKKQFKPIYYATVSLLKDERHQEYLRMGSELKDTVDEILQKVEDYRVKYG